MLHQMARDRVTDVGGILVDRAVLEQRFRCVPNSCAPGRRERGTVSCCADVELVPSSAELRRLARLEAPLRAWIAPREPRVQTDEPGFWRTGGGCITRPGRRCVFSNVDPSGRIRCTLHAFARREQLPRERVQPLSCRLFPLILVDLGRSGVALTVVSKSTWRLVSAHRPQRYPCLRDARLPWLTESMRADLDWLFGAGFAAALARRRKELAPPPARARAQPGS